MSNVPSGADETLGESIDPPETPLDSERYGHLSLDNGEIVIYDREDSDTWVQSDLAVDVDA